MCNFPILLGCSIDCVSFHHVMFSCISFSGHFQPLTGKLRSVGLLLSIYFAALRALRGFPALQGLTTANSEWGLQYGVFNSGLSHSKASRPARTDMLVHQSEACELNGGRNTSILITVNTNQHQTFKVRTTRFIVSTLDQWAQD